MGGKFKQHQWDARAGILANGKKMTVAIATGPAGAIYKQGTAKDAANSDRTNKAMAEYMGVLLESMASRAVRTLTEQVDQIGEKPKRKYRSVALAATGELPVVKEVSN